MNYEQWVITLNQSVALMVQKVSTYLPSLAGATALLLVGWILARILRAGSVRLVGGLDRLVRGHGMERWLIRIGLERPASDVIGAIAFWVVFILFFTAATETLGLPVVATWLGGISTYLPRVLVAVLIILAGLLAGNLARDAITTAAAAANIGYGAVLGRLVYIVILLIAAVTGVDQIGIESRFLTATITIVVGAIIGGAALAFGLGAKTAVSNIIASHYVRQIYRVGHTVKVGDVEGKIAEITNTTVILENANSRLVVPAKEFSERVSFLLRGEG